ncbi:lytic polysaccharide monooxygenase, partial [Streptomyces rhizosphaericus]
MLFAVVVGALTWSAPAQAHGSVVGPASRAYHCWERWGNDHMNPAMQTEDPMCW